MNIENSAMPATIDGLRFRRHRNPGLKYRKDLKMNTGYSFIAPVLAVSLLLTIATPAQSQNPNDSQDAAAASRVFPPGSSSNGHTYAVWSAFWHLWYLSIPFESNPINGGDCGTGQLGSVWFLAGIGGTHTVECTVPAGKLIFLPVINALCGDDTPAANRACAKSVVDGAKNLTASVDGTSIPNIKRFRAASPRFFFGVPPGNVLGAEPGFYQGAADGYYLMLGLSPGRHTVRITGSFPDFNFNIDTTFVLKIRR